MKYSTAPVLESAVRAVNLNEVHRGIFLAIEIRMIAFCQFPVSLVNLIPRVAFSETEDRKLF